MRQHILFGLIFTLIGAGLRVLFVGSGLFSPPDLTRQALLLVRPGDGRGRRDITRGQYLGRSPGVSMLGNGQFPLYWSRSMMARGWAPSAMSMVA